MHRHPWIWTAHMENTVMVDRSWAFSLQQFLPFFGDLRCALASSFTVFQLEVSLPKYAADSEPKSNDCALKEKLYNSINKHYSPVFSFMGWHSLNFVSTALIENAVLCSLK